MEKTDKELKSEIIRKIAEVLDKNTGTTRDVWCVLHAIQDGLAFMEDKRYYYRSDLPYQIRTIRESVKNDKVNLYDEMTDDLQEAILTAGANAQGLILINSKSMKEALNEISDEYNS